MPLPGITLQNLSKAMKIAFSLIVILLFPILVNAYTWQFTSPPLQCNNVTLSILGSGGRPPYSLLIVPTGPSPLPNNIEVRSIQNIPFPGISTTLSFNLNYPENSSFVAVVSDGQGFGPDGLAPVSVEDGFGSGGSSTPVTVLQSSDSSCYSPSNPIHQAWYFNIDPTGGLTQCESVRLWWEASFVSGTVNFYGTVPGGTSFVIPQGSLSSNSDTGTGFDWTVDIAGGTNVILIGNDGGGIGSGGSAEFTIGYTMNNSCLIGNFPSSTAGNPAGGSYPTSTSESSINGSGSYPTSTGKSSSSGSGSHSSSNTSAIVGGVVGAVIALVVTGLVAFWFFIRRSRSALSQQRPVNVLQDDEDGNAEYHGLPQYYVPESYPVPDSTTTGRGTSEAASTHDRPLLMPTVTADLQRSQTPATSTTTTRKGAAFSQSRPVNIIEHDDAGPGEDLSSRLEPETIEFPPSYSNIRQPQRYPLASSIPTAAKDEY